MSAFSSSIFNKKPVDFSTLAPGSNGSYAPDVSKKSKIKDNLKTVVPSLGGLDPQKHVLHPFDPISFRFIVLDCHICRFLNRHLSVLHLDTVNLAGYFSFDSLRFLAHNSLGGESSRFMRLLSQNYVEDCHYIRFSISCNGDLPHLHGHVDAYPGNLAGRSTSLFRSINAAGSWCLSGSGRCGTEHILDGHSRVVITSEGPSSCAWCTSCSSCGAAVWHAGLDGQMVFYRLFSCLRVCWNAQMSCFLLVSPDSLLLAKLSMFSAQFLWYRIAHIFTMEASFIAETLLDISITYERQFIRIQVPNTLCQDATQTYNITDNLGSHVCLKSGNKQHTWRVHYNAADLDFDFIGAMLPFVDHFSHPKTLVVNSGKHSSSRAYGIWNMATYAPRVNREMIASILARSSFAPISCMGEAQGEKTVYCPGEEQWYKIADDEFTSRGDMRMYRFNESSENWDYVLTDDEPVHFEEQEFPDSDEEPVEFEQDEAVPVLEADETSSTSSKRKLSDAGEETEKLSPIMMTLQPLLASPMGSLLVSCANLNESAHHLCDTPLKALNDSIRDLGYWMTGMEQKKDHPRSFHLWVKTDFLETVNKIISHVETVATMQNVMVENDQSFKRDMAKTIEALKRAIEKISADLETSDENFKKISKNSGSGSTLDSAALRESLEVLETKVDDITSRFETQSDSIRDIATEAVRKISNKQFKKLEDKYNRLEGEIALLNKKFKAVQNDLARALVDTGTLRKEELPIGAGDDISSEEEEAPKRPVNVIPQRKAEFPGSIRTKKGRAESGAGEKIIPQTDGKEGIAGQIMNVNNDIQDIEEKSPEKVRISQPSTEIVQMLSNNFRIAQFDWNTTSAVGIVFKDLDFPEVLFSVEWIKTASTMFQYFTCEGIEVEVALTSNMMQGGKLMCFWDSLSSSKRRSVVDILSLSNLPSILLSAGSSEGGKMFISFDVVQSRLSLVGQEVGLLSLGSLRFAALCALKVPANTTQKVSVTVNCRFIGGSLSVRTLPHSYTPKYILPVKKKNGNGGQAETGEGDLVSNRITNNLGGMVNENIIYYQEWKGTDRGRLFSLAVHPCILHAGTAVNVSSLALVSSLYHYWQGSLKYTFHFGANCYTTGKLGVVALPGQKILDDPSDEMIFGTGGVVFNINGADTLEYEVPFYGIAEWQRTHRHSLFDAMYYGEDVVTRLHVWILDPLITNVGATESLDLAVMISPGRDFRLRTPVGIFKGVPSLWQVQSQGQSIVNTSRLVGSAHSLIFKERGHFCQLKLESGKSWAWKVAPLLKKFKISNNTLSWISALFVRWSGSLNYHFIARTHDLKKAKSVRFWHMPEDVEMEKEFHSIKGDLGPTGANMLIWDVCQSNSFNVRVGFQSRFSSLCIPFENYTDIKHHPSFYYNGCLNVAYVGDEEVKVDVFISPGSDFQLMDAAALPVFNEDSGDFVLPYFSDLKSVSVTPVNQTNSLIDNVAKYIGKGKAEAGGTLFEEMGRSFGKGVLGLDTAVLRDLNGKGLVDVLNSLSNIDSSSFDKLNDVLTKVSPLIENLNKRVVEAEDLQKEVTKSAGIFGDLGEAAKKVLQVVKGLYSNTSIYWLLHLKDSELDTFIPTILACISIIAIGVLYWSKADSMGWVGKVALGVALLWAPYIGYQTIGLCEWLKESLHSIYCKKQQDTSSQFTLSCLGQPEGEAGFAGINILAISDYLEVILGGILAIGSLLLLKVMPTSKQIQSWTDSFHDLGNKARSFSNLASLISVCTSWSKTISAKFCEAILRIKGKNLSTADRTLNILAEFDVSEWVSRVNELSLEENKYIDVNTDEKITEVRGLFDKSVVLNNILTTHAVSASAVSVIRDTSAKCLKLINETHSARGVGQPRIDPIHFAFIGEPGTGKSALVQHFTKDLLDALSYPKADRVYARSCADQYWSKYFGQPVVVYDDLGALSGNSDFSDYGEFINLKANIPYSLNMASLDEKGMMFRSDFIISTSNAFYLDTSTNIREPNAFYRRRDVCVIYERDPKVPMDPSSPLKGGLFSVVNTFNHADLRSSWPTYCKNMEGVRMCKVDYSTFLGFAHAYAKGYLEVQKAMVKGMRGHINSAINSANIEDSLEKYLARRKKENETVLIDDDDEREILPDPEPIEPELFWGDSSGSSVGTIDHYAEEEKWHSLMEQDTRYVKKKAQVRKVSPRVQPGRKEALGSNYASLGWIIDNFHTFGITGDSLFNEFNARDIYIPELFGKGILSFTEIMDFICDCRKQASTCNSATCEGSIVWDARIPNEQAEEWYEKYGLGSRVEKGEIRVYYKAIPISGLSFFQFICATIRLYGNSPCVGRSIKALILGSALIGPDKNQDDEFFDFPVFQPEYKDSLEEFDGWLWYKRDDFRGCSPILEKTYGGIPVRLFGRNVFFGVVEPPSKEIVDMNSSAMSVAVSAVSLRAVRLLKNSAPLDLVYVRTILAEFQGNWRDLETPYDEDSQIHRDLSEVYGSFTYGWAILCMLLIGKDFYMQQKMRRANNSQMKKAAIEKAKERAAEMERLSLSFASPWYTKILSYAGGIAATIGVIASGLALWSGIKGLWNFFGSLGKSKKDEAPVVKEPAMVTYKIQEAGGVTSDTDVVEEHTHNDSHRNRRSLKVLALTAQGKGGRGKTSGTSGASNDEKTARAKKKGVIKPNRLSSREYFRREGESSYGVQLDDGGKVNFVHPAAIVQAMAGIASDVGWDVVCPVEVENEKLKANKCFTTIKEWQDDLIKGKRAVRGPAVASKQASLIYEEDDVCVVDFAGSLLRIPRSLIPDIRGDILTGYAMNELVRNLMETYHSDMIMPAKESMELLTSADNLVGKERFIKSRAEASFNIGDPSLESQLDKFMNACCQILHVRLGKRVLVVRVCGSWVLCPAHFVMDWVSGDEMVFVTHQILTRVRFDGSKCFLLGSLSDLVLIDLGPRVPCAPDIRKCFINAESLAKFRDPKGYLMNCHYSKSRQVVFFEPVPRVELIGFNNAAPTVVYDIKDEQPHITFSGFKYRVASGQGFCGSLLISGDRKDQRKLLGIHCAGHQDFSIGFSELVSQEALDSVINGSKLSQFLNSRAESELDSLLVHKPPPSIPTPSLLPSLGLLPANLVPRLSSKTTIIPSPVHKLIGEPVTEPSILSPNDNRLRAKHQKDGVNKFRVLDPLVDAVDKYIAPTRPFKKQDIQAVERFLIKHFGKMKNDRNTRQVLTQHEAINGVEGADFYEPINMDTSPGWPWVLERPRGEHGKQFLFNELEPLESGRRQFELAHTGVQELKDQREESAKRGEREFLLTVECAKDERRAKKKIYEKVATRSFTNLECGANLLYRQYFMDFGTMIMNNFDKSFTQVGIDPNGPEWTTLVHNLLNKGQRGFAGDYAQFDGIGDPEIYMSICDVINAWYADGEENARVRRTLLYDTFHRWSLVRDNVVVINQGLPSGFPMTVIFNSIVNFYLLAMAWCNILERSRFDFYATPECFFQNCGIVTFGDDNIISASDEILEVFNLRSVARWLSDYGIRYTDDAKRPIEESEPFQEILTCTFLKRGIKRIGAVFQAPLNKNSIEEQVHWIRECDDRDGALWQNLNNALYEAHLHGREYFNDLLHRVEVALESVLLEAELPSYEDCSRRFWKGYLGHAMIHSSFDTIGVDLLENPSKWDEPVFEHEDKILTFSQLVEEAPLYVGQVLEVSPLF
ncbi:polyprotein [Persimmon waikavirus]|uniref:Polyprotein n=1 Tax=Persimmon waikavirus TaxID=2590572 RepID=A0ABM7H250_9SECO|nr:polyprotein [Persimmon waikavirus]BBL52501.1 polyprotein [Persimmon waikavirus]